jgi:hypothetical protein
MLRYPRLFVSFFVLASASPLVAAAVLLKDRTEPVIGTLLREDKDRVVLRTLDADGKSHEQTFQRSEIDQLVPAYSTERLAELDPAKPAMYRDYAEELRAHRRDPEARDMALRLYLTAAWLDRANLGRSSLLGMISLARSPQEERKFRAALYLIDPRTRLETLQAPTTSTPAPASEEDSAVARELLRAARLLRTGKGATARSIVEKPAVEKLLANYNRIFSKADFNAAAGQATLERRELRQVLLLELELDALLQPTAATSEPAASLAWSRELQGIGGKAVPSLSLETLTEFDPRQCVWREGKWVEKQSPN